MRVAIVTMVYNERINLPIWVRHYSTHCPGATLFVIDHGSDDGSTGNLSDVNLIPLPHTPFDDQDRADFVSDFQRALLRFYDIFIYVDCDEMLVANPGNHASLASLLATMEGELIAPIGLNVQYIIGLDKPLDLDAPVLGQRRHVTFASSFCKPIITRTPVRWSTGFHWCDRIPAYHPDLYLFHLKKMDMQIALDRMRFTREMSWSERALRFGWAHGQRWSDEECRGTMFERWRRALDENGPGPFVFDFELRRLSESLQSSNGLFVGEHFAGPVCLAPTGFAHLI